MPQLPTPRLTPTARRAALGALGGWGALSFFGCGGGGDSGDGSTSTSSDASLSGLSLSAGTLSPAFAATTTAYTVSVSNGIASLTVTPVATSSGASITVNGTAVASGAASGAIALAVGTTGVTIVVTAANGTSIQSTTVSVVRAAATSASNCAVIPDDEIGPFPLLAILSNAAMVRSDVRESETGVPLRLALTFTNVNDNCKPLTGAAVYLWHCDKDGEYSGYSSQQNGSHLGETYLRGIQVTDSAGQIAFTTIYPGWYEGRVTHIHLQVYLNDNLSVTATATTQLAFPEAITTAVYGSALYTHGQNTSVSSNAADTVFSDGTTYQMLSLTGDVTIGYSATLNIGIAT